MNYKEKLKAIINSNKTPFVDIDTFLKYFPELAESEDERIRKALKEYFVNSFQNNGVAAICGVHIKDILAWLEKQGENVYNEELSKLLHKVICHFINNPDIPYSKRDEVSKKVIPYVEKLEKQAEHDYIEEPNFFDDFRKTDSEIEQKPADNSEVDQHSLPVSDNSSLPTFNEDIYHPCTEKVYEQKPAWSEEDIETIERIVCILDGIRYYNTVDNKQEKPYQSEIDWLKFFKDRVLLQPKQEWKQENTYDLTDFENAMMHIGGSFFGDNAGLDPNDTNAIKEQANILLELVPKQEWSEEDEDMINSIIRELIHQYNEEIPQGTEDKIKWLKNRLKSLKERCTWKPSEEQMELIKDIVFKDRQKITRKELAIFHSIYNDLTKLTK